MAQDSENRSFTTLQVICLILSVISMAAGAVIMVLGYKDYLLSGGANHVMVGQSAFVTGSVLFGSGLVALALACRKSG